MGLIRRDVAHRAVGLGQPITPREAPGSESVFFRAPYSYQPTGVNTPPVVGQIVHVFAAGTMLIHGAASNAAELEGKLRQLRVGSTITVNGVLYQVIASPIWQVTYLQVSVTPLTQAGPAGSYTVEFSAL